MVEVWTSKPKECLYCGGIMENVSSKIVNRNVIALKDPMTQKIRAYDLYECTKCPFTALWRIHRNAF